MKQPLFGEQRTHRCTRTGLMWVSTYTGNGWIQKLCHDHEVKTVKRDAKDWVYNHAQ